MKIYAITPHDASQNLFISSLYSYRKKMDVLSQQKTESNVFEMVCGYRACFESLKQASECALDMAKKTHFKPEEGQDCEDFKTWLRLRRAWINAAFMLILSKLKEAKAEAKDIDLVASYVASVDHKIIACTGELLQMQANIGDFDQLRIELDHIQVVVNNLKKQNNMRPSVLKNYLEFFNNILSKLQQWTGKNGFFQNENNKHWLKGHYDTLCSLLPPEIAAKLTIVFANVTKNEDSLMVLVENGIKLCFAWEKTSYIEKTKVQLATALDEIRQRYNSAIEAIPNVWQRIRDLLLGIGGVIFLPLIAPGCLIADAISPVTTGESRTKRYYQYLQDNFKSAWAFAKEHPILALLITAGIITSIVIPIAVPGELVGGLFFILGEAAFPIALVVTPMLIGMHASHATEVELLKARHQTQMTTCKHQHELTMLRLEQENEERKRGNQAIMLQEEAHKVQLLKWLDDEQQASPAAPAASSTTSSPPSSLTNDIYQFVFRHMNKEDLRAAKADLEEQSRLVDEQEAQTTDIIRAAKESISKISNYREVLQDALQGINSFFGGQTRCSADDDDDDYGEECTLLGANQRY